VLRKLGRGATRCSGDIEGKVKKVLSEICCTGPTRLKDRSKIKNYRKTKT
jgi:hypothetical protein